MPLPLSLEPEAEADLLDGYEWYEGRREGLGREFLDCVDDAFERIANNPEGYAISYRNIRQALVRRFPYVVCFVIETGRATVIAVFHGRKDPQGWQSRVK